MSPDMKTTQQGEEKLLVCGVLLPENAEEYDGALSEARGLVTAAGAEEAVWDGEPLVQRRRRPDASTMLGKGKVAEIKEAIEATGATAVFVDNNLSPAQGRNLEKAWGTRVIDRSEIILDIFATRARTKQARLQVELAQMEYMRPRLRRMWTHLERLDGAIGARGPGETQLETDRRLLDKRITELQHRLNDIEAHKRRQVLSRDTQFTIGLVGYTNAGKSTLLNKVTGADVLVADMLFATLDTRTRQWALDDGRNVLLSDTVGFLQRLPHHLVASFHATLEEALSVDLIVHVIDASHPDAVTQMEAVESTLAKLTQRDADLLVMNKVDLLEDPVRLHLLLGDRTQPVVHLSAHTGEGIERLHAAIAERLDARSAEIRMTCPMSDGRSLAAAKSMALILEEDYEGEFAVLRMRVSESALGNLRHSVSADVKIEVLQAPREPLLRAEDEVESPYPGYDPS